MNSFITETKFDHDDKNKKILLYKWSLVTICLLFFPIPMTYGIQNNNIRIFEDYSYTSDHEYKKGYNENLNLYSIEIIAEQLEDKEHNITLVIDTKDEIRYKHFYYPEGSIKNVSKKDKHFVTLVFNGSECRLRLIFAPQSRPFDPLNLSLSPNDTDLFSASANGELEFKIILNSTIYWDNLFLQITSDQYPNPIIENYNVQSKTQFEVNKYQRNSLDINLLNVTPGNHELGLYVDYNTPEGNMIITARGEKSNTTITPIDIYINDEIIIPEYNLGCKYEYKRIEYIEGEIPWIYAYRNPRYYHITFNSTNNLIIRLDESNRENVEFIIIESNISRYKSIEKDIYGIPCFELEFDLIDKSLINLGLSIRDKIWFIRPSILKLEDIPQNIKKEYLTPGHSYDKKYIDINEPIISRWAQQVVGNETNPYYIAYNLYQNLTKIAQEYSSMEYSNFTGDQEYASYTLKEKKGVCRHFSRAYVALCMVSGIPARTVRGTAFGDPDLIWKKNHEWAEVYFPRYGWISIDVTWSKFGILSNTHVQSSFWNYLEDTLNVTVITNQDRIPHTIESRKTLSQIIDLCINDINTFPDKRTERETLLEQAKILVSENKVHDTLLLLSKANLDNPQKKNIPIRSLFSWIKNNLEILSLFTIGFISEKYYPGRLSVFSNSMTLNVFFLKLDYTPWWLNLYLIVGTLLGLIGVLTYISRESLPTEYYEFCLVYNGSVVTSLMMIFGTISYALLPLLLSLIILFIIIVLSGY